MASLDFWRLAPPFDAVVIAPAELQDLPEILALFDDTVAWLAARGLTGQWGETPFSQLPTMVRHFRAWIEHGDLVVARTPDAARAIVGTLVIRPTSPDYARAHWERSPVPAGYIEAFTTARSRAGQGVGRALLHWAEVYAQREGMTRLRLDCWAGNPALCAYYERAGFAPRGDFLLGTWRGQLFEKPITHKTDGRH